MSPPNAVPYNEAEAWEAVERADRELFGWMRDARKERNRAAMVICLHASLIVVLFAGQGEQARVVAGHAANGTLGLAKVGREA